ncbi:histidine phosphatase family protein [Amycolatopsis sacchari]|uniref:histidine phosphatase family protein n=1 Tax=Amycolatopsis sacchari TaxID=115433 RepID=UPI003EBE1D59
MGNKTVVHVVRHGEVRNPDGILYGRLEGFRLSPYGVEQARRVAEHLAERDIVHVVCSPLERAKQTAAPIAARHGLAAQVDERLTETANRFEGRKVGLADVAWRDIRGWLWLYNPFRPSWSEAFAAIARRMTLALHQARDLAAGHEAVCVSHQLPIWILRRFQEGRRLWHDPRRRQCGLASLTSFEFAGSALTGIRYAEPSGDSVAAAEWVRP